MTEENYDQGFQENGYRSRGHGVGKASHQTARGQFAHDFNSQYNRRLGKGLEESQDDEQQELQDASNREAQRRLKYQSTRHSDTSDTEDTTSTSSHRLKRANTSSAPLQGMVGMGGMAGMTGMRGMGQ